MGRGSTDPRPFVVEEEMAVVSGRLPQSEREKNLRKLIPSAKTVATAIKMIILAILVMTPLVFINYNQWQSNCLMTGGTLTGTTSCFYPAHNTFTGEYVPPTTKHYQLLSH